MSRLLAACLAASAAGSILGAPPAIGYTPPELPWANCSGDIAAQTTVLEARALPADEATVTAGGTVTFSAPSSVPLTFAIASSPQSLADPDIDHGPGQPSGVNNLQTFTSLKAAATAGTAYWTVSFQSEALTTCSGFAFGPSSVPPRKLTIEPAAPPAQVPLARAAPAQLKVKIIPDRLRRGNQMEVEFEVRCNTGCSGTVSYTASAALGRLSVPVPALDFGRHGVSITSPAGGAERFSRRYTGRSLRELERLIEHHHTLELLATFSAKSLNGSVARTRAAFHLAK